MLSVLDNVLTVTGLLPGDLDANGDVAFTDFLMLSNNFGQQVGSYADGDIDCSGKVDFADFLVLSANFGKRSGSTSAVPEPSGLMLLGLGVLLLKAARRRCTRQSNIAGTDYAAVE